MVRYRNKDFCAQGRGWAWIAYVEPRPAAGDRERGELADPLAGGHSIPTSQILELIELSLFALNRAYC
jgi:hypothetical protein